MRYIFLYILAENITSIIAVTLRKNSVYNYIDKIGKKGYKLDYEKFCEITKDKKIGDHKLKTIISFMIPGINIINCVIKNHIEIKKINKELEDNNAFIPMDENEIEYYNTIKEKQSKVQYLLMCDELTKTFNDITEKALLYLTDAKVLLEKNIVQLYYDKLPIISYSLEEVKQLSDSINSHYKLGKMNDINTAIIGLPEECTINSAIVKNDDKILEMDYQEVNEDEYVNKKFVIYPFNIDFEESQELKDCYQKIIDKRDNKVTNNNQVVYNIYYNDERPYTSVKKKVK